MRKVPQEEVIQVMDVSKIILPDLTVRQIIVIVQDHIAQVLAVDPAVEEVLVVVVVDHQVAVAVAEAVVVAEVVEGRKI